ncbi:hypothetical protein N7530_010742 [Penicillium desertorum]|uniref:Uncharacterized protein n=1 Tax=Penicillium desertorum TaxID=1303715 RepID=A0A9W9WFW1_9EURO|nr:hypothetical protein N7530_010742 [Penicillium desertorum]
MANITTKEMWETVKRYFGDSHIPGSAPLGLMHICEMDGLCTCTNVINTSKKGSEYGVEISEDLMPMFSILGDTASPPCTCFEMTDVLKHIEEYIETAPDTHPNDMSIASG